MNEKELVTALIAEHLRSAGLIAALENTGFLSSSYHPQLGKAIMKIMNVESSLALMYYLNLIDNCVREKRNHDEDVEDLYGDLVWMRQEIAKNT